MSDDSTAWMPGFTQTLRSTADIHFDIARGVLTSEPDPSDLCINVDLRGIEDMMLGRRLATELRQFSMATKAMTPIERRMYVAMLMVGIRDIRPQFPIGRYRADFAVLHKPDRRIVVECDGHDFHEKTKKQAAHDKKRDRFLQGEGWPVLRFTGQEIVTDVEACATEVAIQLGVIVPGCSPV